MPTLPHALNWVFGWSLLLAAFGSGAVIGLLFHRDSFLGGYGSFSRRLVRLGHISLAALGIINVLYSVSPWPEVGTFRADVGSFGFALGGAAMPAVCFLTAWRQPFRLFFFIPVSALIVAG